VGVKSTKGQITVFLCVILLSVVALAGILVDGARISTAEVQVERGIRSAIKSSLASYGSGLKNEYGIFALSMNEEDELSNVIKDYVEKNLCMGESPDNNRNEKPVDLYDFRIEEINAVPVLNLTDNEVVKKQILEYMKYRAPKEIVEDMLEKLSIIKKSSAMSEAYKKKTGADKLLGKLDKLQQRLKKNISGTEEDSSCFVNGFNRNKSRSNAVSAYAGLFMEYTSLKDNLKEIVKSISELRKSAGEASEGIDESIKELEAVRNGILKSMTDAKSQLDVLWDTLYNKETYAYIRPNEEAAENIRAILETGRNAETVINELERYVEGNFDEADKITGVFSAAIHEDIKQIKDLVLKGKQAEELLNETEKNRKLLTDTVKELTKAKSYLWSSTLPEISASEIVQLLNKGLENYNNGIEYDYTKPDKGEKGQDPRAGTSETIQNALKEVDGEDRNIEGTDIDKNELPSYKKIPSRFFDVEDSLNNIGDTDRIESNETENKASYRGDIGKIDKEADLKNEEGNFTENALDFVSSMGEFVSKDLSQLRDEIFIDEYIMRTFRNSVPVLEDKDGQIVDRDLRGMDKRDRETFFESEVEYILHGKTSENANRILTRSQVLLIRFALDTIHVYTDSKKRELASGIAAAAAGWWTGGAGIPIISNLIMCGWSMGEAVIDLKELMEGRYVPFYKSEGDWKLDIGLPKGGRKSDDRLAFSYHDYLRLLLLLKSQDIKISRIEDLIELNLRKADRGFRMGSANTYVMVEAVVSMRYFFMTAPFVPAAKKTTDGRHKIRVVIYDGY